MLAVRGSKPAGGKKSKKRASHVMATSELKADRLMESHGFLEAEHANEETWKIRQKDILENVDLGVVEKVWRTNLCRGPYFVDYTDDGQVLLAAGQKGDAHLIDVRSRKNICSVYPNESIRAVKICYNESCWAVAQKHSVCLYDARGTKIHDFNETNHVSDLEYLNFHFLLVTGAPNAARIQWRDLSTGKYIASLSCKNFSSSSMSCNPYNAMISTGHTNGSVSLWSPNLEKPALTFHANSGGCVGTCAFKNFYMATSSNHGPVAIFDTRRPGNPLRVVPLRNSGNVALATSQTGLLGVAQGPQVSIWKDLDKSADNNLYMRHTHNNGLRMNALKFQPFEDILCLGLNQGYESIVIPGAGMANIDSDLSNPYATSREKAFALVRRLIDKLPADTIMLDPTAIFSVVASKKQKTKS